MHYASNVVTEIRRRAYRGLEATRGSAGASAMVGCCVLEMFVCVSGPGPWALFKHGATGLFAQENFSAVGGITTESCFPKYPMGLGWIDLSSGVFALVSFIRAVFRDTLILLEGPLGAHEKMHAAASVFHRKLFITLQIWNAFWRCFFLSTEGALGHRSNHFSQRLENWLLDFRITK